MKVFYYTAKRCFMRAQRAEQADARRAFRFFISERVKNAKHFLRARRAPKASPFRARLSVLGEQVVFVLVLVNAIAQPIGRDCVRSLTARVPTDRLGVVSNIYIYVRDKHFVLS